MHRWRAWTPGHVEDVYSVLGYHLQTCDCSTLYYYVAPYYKALAEVACSKVPRVLAVITCLVWCCQLRSLVWKVTNLFGK